MATEALQTVEDFREAIGVLAKAITELQAIVKAQGEIQRGMDAQLKLLTALVDHHHSFFVSRGWAKPRPAGGNNAAN